MHEMLLELIHHQIPINYFSNEIFHFEFKGNTIIDSPQGNSPVYRGEELRSKCYPC